MGKKVACSSVGFEGYEHMDAAFSAMLVADDGRVYTGLCTHNGKDDGALGWRSRDV